MHKFCTITPFHPSQQFTKVFFANASVGTIPYFCGRGDETPTSWHDLKNPVLQSQKPSHDESKSFCAFACRSTLLPTQDSSHKWVGLGLGIPY